MKDKETLHKKVQEQIDCYATTDPLKEMSELAQETDTHEAALKWISLAALHGINMNAKKILVQKSKEGQVKVIAKYRSAELPSPGSHIGEKVFEYVRGITHLEEVKGKTALGIRDSSIDLKVKVKKDADRENISLIFSG